MNKDRMLDELSVLQERFANGMGWRDGEYAEALDEAIELINQMPSADVVEVKHGEWQITDAYPHNVYCSECHERFAQTHWVVWEDGSLPRNFCPYCGAKMRRDND